MAELRYSRSRMAYRDARGKYVSLASVRSAVEQVAQKTSDALASLTARHLAGDLKLDAWKGAMAGEIKLAHLAIGTIGHGGKQAMTNQDKTFISQTLRSEFGYLDKFATQLGAGTAGSDAKVINRARLYGQSARLTFEAIRDRDAAEVGMNQERNLMGGAEHCGECPGLSRRGWVKAGTLPPVGSRACRMGCKCVIERRRTTRRQRQQEAA